MDMEGVLAIIFIFGGGSMFLLAISPVGRAFADRIRGGTTTVPDDTVRRLEAAHQDVLEELDSVRREVVEIHERLDFTERVLAQRRNEGLPAGGTPDGL
jgi:hypothetical protein